MSFSSVNSSWHFIGLDSVIVTNKELVPTSFLCSANGDVLAIHMLVVQSFLVHKLPSIGFSAYNRVSGYGSSFSRKIAKLRHDYSRIKCDYAHMSRQDLPAASLVNKFSFKGNYS